MSSIMREHLIRLNTCQLIRPIAAAAGALLAWKYLPSMTEELWYHALQFLDRHRTKSPSNEISSLYQFVDPTGILEQHKQMLFQPFNENKVDMKIIYYELIKMLIDYERRNNPTAYDATKTVAKIEGYQELTNKLQRFLNQRFILDIQKLSKTQEEIPSNVTQKIEKLEHEFTNMRKTHVSLEDTNKTLIYEISKLKEREAEIMKKLEHFESVELSIDESNRKLVERVESIELEGKKLDGKMTKLNNNQQSEMLKIFDQTSKNTLDVKHILERNNEMNDRLEAQEKVSKQTWKSVEYTLMDHKNTISEIKQIGTINETKTEELKNNVLKLSESILDNSKAIDNNTTCLQHMNTKVSVHESIFQKIDIDNMSVKIEQLENTYHENEAKIQGMDVVRRKVNLIEENRQQSAAKIQDDMDETKRRNENIMEKIRKELRDVVNNLHKELETHTALNAEQVKSLQTEVTQTLQSSDEHVRAAEVHVDNLRQLNRNIIDQLKEKTSSEQKMSIEKMKTSYQEYLYNFRQDVSKEIEKASTSDMAIADVTNKMDMLTSHVTTVVGNEEKIKDIVNTIESNQRMEQNSNETMFSIIKSENRKLKTEMTEMQTALYVQKKTSHNQIIGIKEWCDKHHSQYVNTTADQANMISNTNEKLSAIMDTASKLMMGCAAQEENLTRIEKNSKDFDKKLLDLESAEMFLQESHKLVVGRSDAAEQQMKQLEQNVIKMGEKQKTEILGELQKESKTIIEKAELLDLSCNRKMNESDEKINKIDLHLESFKELMHNSFKQIENVKRQVSDDISKVKTQLEEHKQSAKNSDNLVKKVVDNIENYNKKLNQLEPCLETIENKFSNLENSLKDEIAVRGNQAVETTERIETCNDNFSMIEMKIKENTEEITSKFKNIIENISQKNDQIDKIAQDNSNKHNALKNEKNVEKEIVVQRIEDFKLLLKKMETDFDTMKTSGSNKSDIIKEQLGNQLNICSSMENRIVMLEKQGSDQTSLIKVSENTSKERFELVEHEIKVEFRNSKEELRKLRAMMATDKNNLLTLLMDFYLVFKFSTIVVQSCGAVSDMYGNLLGVYRVVGGSLYKQEGGENYIYYSVQTDSWLVGTVAGHPYGWLRNCSISSSPSLPHNHHHHLPPISTGWQYRVGSDWHTDYTFRLQPCPEVKTLETLMHQTECKDE